MNRIRLQTISNLALPLIAGAVATNIMSLVDTAMVGQLGDAALGGVGIGGQLFFLVLAVLLGLSAGVQATVARRVGQDQLDVTGRVLNAGIVLALLVALALMALLYPFLPALFALVSNDVAVRGQGVDYLTTRLPSLIFIGINIAFRSYWIGVSQAKWSMWSIISLSVSNVVFNYVLIFGHFGAPRMEVAGAGLGSTLATLVGLLVNVGLALKLARQNGFLHGLPPPQQIRTLLTISYPESLRQIFFSVGVVLFYVAVGYIGTQELAAFHVVISICLIAYLPHIGIAGTATTLVGEAIGRNNVADAKQWGWQVANTGFVVLLCLSLLILLYPQPVLQLFLVDDATLRLAILPLQLGLLAHVMDGYGKILSAALVGAGATKTAMIINSLLQWLFFLPLLALSIYLGYGLVAAFSIFLLWATFAAMVLAFYWQREKWRNINL